MHPYENAEQDVVTSAPPLDFGDTWSGGADEAQQVDVLRLQLAQAHTALENAQYRERQERARSAAAEARLSELMTRGLDAAPVAELRAAIARREQQISLGGARGDGPEATCTGAPVSPPAREPSSPPGPGAAVGLGGAL